MHGRGVSGQHCGEGAQGGDWAAEGAQCTALQPFGAQRKRWCGRPARRDSGRQISTEKDSLETFREKEVSLALFHPLPSVRA